MSAVASARMTREEYREIYLRSDHWQQTRRAALDRADHRCQVCNGTQRLDVHHRTYERLGAEEPGDLTVLCRKCHDIFHGKSKLTRPKRAKASASQRRAKKKARSEAQWEASEPLRSRVLEVLDVAVRGMKAGEISFKLAEDPTLVHTCLMDMHRRRIVNRSGRYWVSA